MLKTKIVFFSNKNIFYVDGAYSNRIRGLQEGIAKHGIEIHIIVKHGCFELNEYFFHKKFKYPKNFYIHYVGYPYQLRVIKRLKLFDMMSRLILKKQKKLQEKNEFDFSWIDISISEDSIKELKDNKVKIIHEVNEFPNLMLDEKLYKIYLNKIVSQIDIIFLMTNSLFEFYKKTKNSETKLFLIPMTVDSTRFRKSKPIFKNKQFTITYVGLMNNKKDGVDILIKAFSIVNKKYPNTKLKLIGPKKPVQDYLQQLKIIKNKNLEDKVEYLGEISRNKVPNLLLESDCLALARPKSIQAQYGFPTKLGEYLMTGKPVVVTSVGDITYYLKDNYNAFIAEPDNVQDFANKIINVINDKENAKKVGKNGKSIALSFFDSKKQSENIVKILNISI